MESELAAGPLGGVIVTVPLYVPAAMLGPTTFGFNDTATAPGAVPVDGTISQLPPVEVDGVTVVMSTREVAIGEIVTATVTGADGVDLIAEAV